MHTCLTSRTSGTVGALLCACALATSGCALSSFRNPFRPVPVSPPAPEVLSGGASVGQIIAAVNDNSSRVQSYAANGATITPQGMPGTPALTGSVVVERPNRFRLRAGLALLGQQIDMGSGDELVWMWYAQNQPPAVYVGRREELATAIGGMALPINPDWFPQALGMVSFEDAAQVEGPRLRPDGRLELTTRSNGPEGPTSRTLVIDPVKAWVMEQHVYDARGQLIASAVASDFWFYPEHQVSLPQQVQVHLPTIQMSLRIRVGQVVLNALSSSPEQWLPPQIDGYPQVNLGGTGQRVSTTTWHATTGRAREKDVGAQAVGVQSDAVQPAHYQQPRPQSTWQPVHRLPRP